MTTYRFGTWFSAVAFAALGLLGAAIIFLPAYRIRLFIGLALPALLMLAARRLVRCTICGKSAFLHEIFSQDSLLGLATNPRRMIPEQTCSRCRADLTIQQR